MGGKKPLSDEQKQAVTDRLSALLALQMEFAPVSSFEVTKVG